MIRVLFASSSFRTVSSFPKNLLHIEQPRNLYDFIYQTRHPNVIFRTQRCIELHTDSFPNPSVQSLTRALNSHPSSSLCRNTHAQAIKSLTYSNGFIGDRLVSVYIKLGCLEDAQLLFDEMADKDLVSWNSLISGFSRKGDLHKCFEAFHRMRFEMGMEPNEVTLLSIISACTEGGALEEGRFIHGFAMKSGLLFETKVINSLLNMYGKFGHLDLATRLFEAIPLPNLVSWNSFIAVYVQNGYGKQGISLFNFMRRAGTDPDRATIVSLLKGCADIGVGKLPDSVHAYIISAGLGNDTSVRTALLSVYARSGRLEVACDVFREMEYPDKIAWTAMLGGYAMHGYGRRSIEFFDFMVGQGFEPDHVIFTHLLSACSHSGLVEEGKRFFDIMYCDFGVEPQLEHYSCMVDLLGRSGNLRDAHALIASMPMEPNSGVWAALLNACKVHRNLELGKEIAERLFALSPPDCRNYIMLSNMYTAAGHWEDASNVRSLMKKQALERNPGCSFIEHGNKIYRFVSGDHSHPESKSIYTKLEQVTKKIQNVGYSPDTELVLHDVNEDVKKDMINKHGEKLAIAFGLLVIRAGTPLIITKNLRICDDCHNMAKFVSLVEDCKIIIRDPKRFHHFSNGLCSCGDYW